MRSLLRWLLPVLAAGAVAAGVAHAQTNAASSAVTWPATCELKTSGLARMQCADKHINALDTRLRAVSAHELVDRARIAALRARNTTLASCLGEYPVTRKSTEDNYTIPFDSNNDGNYDSYNWYGQLIPDFLQQTQSGDSVDYWFVRDTCSTAVFSRPPTP